MFLYGRVVHLTQLRGKTDKTARSHEALHQKYLWMCHVSVSLSTICGRWQSDVIWSQHYLSLSRQLGVSSINLHPSSAEKHTLRFTCERPRGGEFTNMAKTIILGL